jgi:hypothetical protein
MSYFIKSNIEILIKLIVKNLILCIRKRIEILIRSNHVKQIEINNKVSNLKCKELTDAPFAALIANPGQIIRLKNAQH